MKLTNTRRKDESIVSLSMKVENYSIKDVNERVGLGITIYSDEFVEGESFPLTTGCDITK